MQIFDDKEKEPKVAKHTSFSSFSSFSLSNQLNLDTMTRFRSILQLVHFSKRFRVSGFAYRVYVLGFVWLKSLEKTGSLSLFLGINIFDVYSLKY